MAVRYVVHQLCSAYPSGTIPNLQRASLGLKGFQKGVTLVSSSSCNSSTSVLVCGCAFGAELEEVAPAATAAMLVLEKALTLDDSEVSLTAALNGFHAGSKGLLTGYGTATGGSLALGPILGPPLPFSLVSLFRMPFRE